MANLSNANHHWYVLESFASGARETGVSQKKNRQKSFLLPSHCAMCNVQTTSRKLLYMLPRLPGLKIGNNLNNLSPLG